MSKPTQVTPRMRALFALDKLSRSLQSDVLADGTVEKRWKIPVRQTMTVGKGISIKRADLFAVLRACADGQPISALVNDAGTQLDAKASPSGQSKRAASLKP
jgi:hypothetical protein